MVTANFANLFGGRLGFYDAQPGFPGFALEIIIRSTETDTNAFDLDQRSPAMGSFLVAVAVPEPASLAALCTGLFAFAAGFLTIRLKLKSYAYSELDC